MFVNLRITVLRRMKHWKEKSRCVMHGKSLSRYSARPWARVRPVLFLFFHYCEPHQLNRYATPDPRIPLLDFYIWSVAIEEKKNKKTYLSIGLAIKKVCRRFSFISTYLGTKSSEDFLNCQSADPPFPNSYEKTSLNESTKDSINQILPTFQFTGIISLHLVLPSLVCPVLHSTFVPLDS